MNRAYKSIYNEHTGTYVAVAETVSRRGKRSSSSRLMRTAAAAIVSGVAMGGTALAAVDIPNDGADNVIEFTAPNGAINFTGGGSIDFGGTGSITGLENLTVSGSITADQLIVTNAAALASGGMQAATVGQLFDLSGDLTALEGRVGTNETAIDGLTTRVADNETATSNLDTRVGDNETAIGTLQGDVSGLEGDVTALQGDIAAQDTRISQNKTDIDEIFSNLGVHEGQDPGGGIQYFRANSALADSVAEGTDAVAIGPEAEAKGDQSFAIGTGAITENTRSIAIGDGAATRRTPGAIDQENTIAIGTDSESSGAGGTAIGHKANASGVNAIAFGSADASGAVTTASGAHALALGTAASSGGDNAIAMGSGASAGGSAGVALGEDAEAEAEDNIAIGREAGKNTTGSPVGDRKQNVAIGALSGQDVESYGNTAIGYGAGSGIKGTNSNNNVAMGTYAGTDIEGERNISIGYQANQGVTANKSIAIGEDAKALSEGIAIGLDANVGSGGLAFGRYSDASGLGVALGASATAASGYVALGSGSVARQEDVVNPGYLTNQPVANVGAVSVGSSVAGSEKIRRIVNVADGYEDSDAVTVAQLKYAIAGVELPDIDIADGIVSDLQEQIDQNMQHYVSINDGGDEQANKGNNEALAINSMAIGADAQTTVPAEYSIAMGHTVATHAASAIALGHNVIGSGINSTTIGNSESQAQGESSIAIGTSVKSVGNNSIVIGRESSDDLQGNGAENTDNSIVIGTESISTAEEGIVIGKDSWVNSPRGIAQGSNAQTSNEDAIAQGTQSRASGKSAIAQGTNANASGLNAMAQGTESDASGDNAQASGYQATAYAQDGVALGTGATAGFEPTGNPLIDARNTSSIAIGASARAEFENALAVGVGAQATEADAVAVGTGAEASDARAMAQGFEAIASAEDAMALGSGAVADQQDAIAQGTGAHAAGVEAIATGAGAVASGPQAIAQGAGAWATANQSLALGAGAQAGTARSVALGDKAVTDDAVGTSSITIDKKTYQYAGTSPVGTVSVGTDDDKRTITNVAAGRVNKDSTDAINGSQLFRTNESIEALADDLDTAGDSVATALGGDSSYNPATHTVTANLAVNGNTYNNVQDALQYVGQGWTLTTNDSATTATQVLPGQQVSFDEGQNIDISQDGLNVTIATATDVAFDKITVGETTIDQNDGIVTNKIVVNHDNDEIDVGDTLSKGITFGADDGTPTERKLGDTINIVGDDNITTAVDEGQIEIALNKDIDLTEDGSVTVGDSVLDTGGLTVADGDGNTTAVGAGVINVAGGSNTIVIDGDSGTIAGLANQDVDYAGFADGSGRAATEEQLQQIASTASAGWTVTDGEQNDAKIGPGGTVTFEGDSNIAVNQTGEDQDGVIEIALNENIDLGEDGSVTIGDSVLDTDGLAIEDDDGNITTTTAAGVNITDGDHTVNLNASGLVINGGPSITIAGIDAGEQKIINVAPGAIGPDSMDAINGSQLWAMGDSLTQFFGDGVTLNDDGTFNWDDYFSEIFGVEAGITNLAQALEPWTVGAEGGDSEPVLPGDNVDFSGGGSGGGGGAGNTDGNIVVDIDHDGTDHNLTLDLADNITVNQSVTVGDASGDGPYVTIGDDGDQGSAGSVTWYGESDGGSRPSASQSVVSGPGGVGTDQDDADTTRLGYTDESGNQQVLATLDDGLSFGANDGQHDAPLNTQVDIVGGDGNTDWSEFDAGQNIMTKVTQSEEGIGQIMVALANDLDVSSVTTNEVRINNGPIINEDGIDMSDKRITNVAPGIDRGDAVNVGQLQDTAANLQGQINTVRGDMHRMDRRLRAGVAAAMATAGLPQAYLPGKSMMAIAGGTWNGESGMAIGYSTITDNGKWVVKLSGNASSRGDYGGALGVGFQW